MIDPFTAAIGGSVISGVGGIMGANASRQAGREQAQAAMFAAQLQAQEAAAARQQQMDMFNKAIALQEPFRQGGIAATNRMQELYGIGGSPTAAGYGSYAKPFGMADFQMDPGYGFRVQQGQQAINRSAAAAAGLQSGAALKAAARFGQDMGSQEYGNAYNRFMQQRELQLRALQGLASPGSSMAAGMGQQAVNTGANISNTMMQGAQAMGQGIENAGAARASSYMGSSSALQGALNGFGQNAMLYSMMNRMYPQN